MKKSVSLLVLVVLWACSSSHSNKTNPLFEILTQEATGGAPMEFYEILTEENEIKMLLKDPKLKKKVRANDMETCNYIILNLGEQPSDAYSITIDNAVEARDTLFLKVKKNAVLPQKEFTGTSYYPFTVVKVASKKPIKFL